MYEPLLLIHSWMRWAVLFGMIYFLSSCLRALFLKRAWSATDANLAWGFNQLFLFQALFGFTLWVAASPIVRATFLQPSAIFSAPAFTFWTLIHPLMMIASIGVFHVGKARANRMPPEKRFRAYAVTLTIVLIMVVGAIPWPFLEYGRPLARIP